MLLALMAALGAGPAHADEELDFGLEERAVERVEFVGVETFDSERLLPLLGLRAAPWYAPFRASTYRLDRVEQGVEALRGFYRREGFHRVQVRLVVQRVDDADVLRIEVVEGPRTLIGELQIVDPEPLTDEQVRSLLEFREGGPAPARSSDLGGDLYRIVDAYLARGHLGARVREDVIPADSTVTVRYTVRAGPVYRLRAIEIEGNDRVREGYIRREFRMEPGDRFAAERIARVEARLLDTGWFRDVGFEPVDLDTTAAEATLRVRVVERPTGFWEFGLGTGTKDRVRLSAAWGDRNVWRSGKGLTVRGRLLGVIEGSVEDPSRNDFFLDHEEELLYRHPHLFGSRFTVNANLFFQNEARPRSGLELERTGLLLNTTVFSGRASTAEIELGVQRTRKLALTRDFEFDNGRALTSSFTAVFTRDTRDDLFQPTRGDLRQLLLQTAGGPLLRGDNSFHKALLSVVQLTPLPGRVVFATRAQAGWIEAWWKSADRFGRDGGVPLEDRFFAGGSSTVRGYRENSLGPRLREDDEVFELVRDPRFLTDRLSAGGNALLLLNAELRAPLPLLSRFGFDMNVFFDAGNVWPSWGYLRLDELRLAGDVSGTQAENALRTSWGVGLQYRTVVGPLRLEYGIPLRRATYTSIDAASGAATVADQDPERVWHFSLGHAF